MFGMRFLAPKRILSSLVVLWATCLCSSQLPGRQLPQAAQAGTPNTSPVADAGVNQIVRLGQTVQLDGSRSRAPNGAIVAYSWTYVRSIPAGLPAYLSDPYAAKPTASIADPGTYVFRLAVTDDTGTSSSPAEVRISTGPVSNAGPDQTVKVGATVQLDGSKSVDPEALPLTFEWKLSAPRGSHARLSNPAAARPSFVTDVLGSYRAELVVSDGSISSEPQGVSIAATTGELSCGSLVSGSIVSAGQTDQYTFQGQANEIVTLTLVNTADGPFGVGLYAPSGQMLTGFYANGQQQVTLTAAGTYVIQVTGSGLTATGQYNLGLECLLNPTAPVTAVLGFGALAHGSLTALGQTNQYTFEGRANEIVTLTLVNTAGGPFGVGLYAPSGQMLTGFYANGQQQITLTAAGTYVIQVTGSGLTATGQYNLGLESLVNPTSPVKAILAAGALQHGSLTALGQTDQYTFQGQANEIVTLTLVNTAGGPAGVGLYAPSGQMLTGFYANGQQQITLTAAGTYVIQVTGSGLTATGQYALGLESLVNPTTPVKAVLGCGALLPGSLTVLGQLDQYTFQGQANEIVTLTLVNTAGGPAGVGLYAPSGQMLTGFYANGQQQITLPASGGYVAQVTGSGLTATGQYNLGLECLTTATPVFSPPPGTYKSTVSVTIADATPGAIIYYTTNGSTPTTSSMKYTGPITVSSSETINAIAVLTGYSPSGVAPATYTIEKVTATPVILPAQGTYNSTISVTITDATAGATIYYTTNGSTPTTSSTKYTGPIRVSSTETIKAIAAATTYSPSGIAAATYTIEKVPPTPVFSPGSGTYNSVQYATISDAMRGATIYYTTNGSTPATSSTKYTAPIAVFSTTTIKAIAVAPGYEPSPVASATYTLVGSPSALAARATSITTSGSTLNAVVNTFGVAGSYIFQYGTSSTALNDSTAKKPLGASTALVPVSISLTGLTAKTQYYYRVVVTTAGGTGTGAVLSFTTE